MVIAGSIIYIANLILPSLTLFGLKGLHLSLSWPLFSIIISTLSAVGLAAGIFPALKAAHIQPVEALRHE
jgi:ABC-type antimicrobial peptide transport system permease subunit